MRSGLLVAVALLVSACATAPPSSTSNACRIFEEHRDWFKAAKKSEDRWKIPVAVSLAFIEQESAFQQKARPERRRLFGIIPGPRPSDAYGYAQALKGTWKDYKRETGNTISSRADFADAVDFIGWYNARSVKENRIAPNDAYNLYLAYHEGQGGFRRKTYDKKAWLITVARGVQSTASQYDAQLQRCEKALGRNWFLRLIF